MKRDAVPSDRSTNGPAFIGGGAPFSVHAEVREGRAIVTAVGEVDRETSSRLASAIQHAAQTSHALELDLEGVTFMDSQGLRVLVEAKRGAGVNISIVITEASPQVRQLLAATGLTETFAPDA